MISGTVPELLGSAASPSTHPDVHSRCSTLVQRLGQAFNGKTDKASNSLASTPYGVVGNSSHRATSLPSPKCASSTYPIQNSTPASVAHERYLVNDGALLTSSSDHLSAPQYLSQDFAVDNNYEGLFAAVELAGVRSSDAVNDLFGQASLDRYTNFDDTWPCAQHSGNTPDASHLWQNCEEPVCNFDEGNWVEDKADHCEGSIPGNAGQ